MSGRPGAAATSADRTTARRGIVLFLILVATLDAIVVTVIATTGNPVWIYGLMWSVAASSIVCRLVFREGFGDVSFRFGGRRSLALLVAGLVFPVVVGFVAFGVAWATGLATFTPPPGGFLAGLAVAATIGTAVSALAATGEEIGWRGYLLTRLIDAGVPRPVLVSGLIWGLWHVPLITAGIIYADHPSTPLAVVVFMISATSAGFLIARLRLETGSIWPPIALHAAYNSVIQSGFSPATSGPNAALWVGEEAGRWRSPSCWPRSCSPVAGGRCSARRVSSIHSHRRSTSYSGRGARTGVSHDGDGAGTSWAATGSTTPRLQRQGDEWFRASVWGCSRRSR